MPKTVTIIDMGKYVALEGIDQADAEDIFGQAEEVWGQIRVNVPVAKAKQMLREKGGYLSKVRKTSTTLRVAARFQQANQPPGARQEAKHLTHPINKPRGIDPDIVREHGRSIEKHFEETVKPEKRDIRPEDVFAGTPAQMGVRNLAETGNDLQKALLKQIPKDKGYDTVSNLSQYLIYTEGGGGTKPVG